MPTVSQGASQTINLGANDAYKVTIADGGDAYVDLLSGAPGSPYASPRLRAPSSVKTFGPYGVPAVLRLRSIVGATTYEQVGQQLAVRQDSLTKKLINSQGETVEAGGPIATITGTLQVGQTLTAAPSPGWKFTSGQWNRDGVAISGATGLTYVLQAADAGKTISFVPTSPTPSIDAGVIAGGAAPSGKYSEVTAGSVAAMGDSITEASAFTTDQRWANKTAARLGATLLNKGISGTVVQNSNDAGGSPRAQNMRDRFIADMGGINKREAFFMAGLFNDARYVGSPPGTKGDFSLANALTDYRQCMNAAMELGYDFSKSLLVVPYYITDTGLNTGSGGFAGVTRAEFVAHVDGVKTIGLEYNPYVSDAYAHMLANGAGALIGPDDIHPNVNGQADIDLANADATRPNPRTAPTLSLAFPSAGTIGYTIGAVADAVSYTIEYMPAGGGTNYEFVGTVTGTNLTGQFTGLTNNFHTVRVRANFAGGLFSGWTPARILCGNALQGSSSFTGTAGTGLSAFVPSVGGAFVVTGGVSAPSTEPVLSGTGTLYATAAASIYRSTTPVLGQNFFVEGVIVWKSSLTGDSLGICTNMSASANTFYFLAFFRTDNTLRLYRNNNGSNAMVASWSLAFNSGSKTIRLTHQVMEGFLRLIPTVDGAPMTSPAYYDDTAPLALGSFGFRDAVAKTSTTGWQLQSLTHQVTGL